ncbi:hypothetical protein M231_03419 [Tremella mesenterica]|uniref:Uncharacterized protein n=1 Tax=Tremella mesenterica TaxID=5217 RepID=A0A4Q1BNK9_TREME|nr:uncharacterized protein TREMEDRAFT_61008 [Tremella mesenterica DSM 1558]EIW70504.1 hypothetical protein TREMEDRAFT_61008 [Tremella mesenterica DSM 1558]RXK39340.1 hypothetical protein M231_03419 [Tremella mesenterica]
MSITEASNDESFVLPIQSYIGFIKDLSDYATECQHDVTQGEQDSRTLAIHESTAFLADSSTVITTSHNHQILDQEIKHLQDMITEVREWCEEEENTCTFLLQRTTETVFQSPFADDCRTEITNRFITLGQQHDAYQAALQLACSNGTY